MFILFIQKKPTLSNSLCSRRGGILESLPLFMTLWFSLSIKVTVKTAFYWPVMHKFRVKFSKVELDERIHLSEESHQ